KELGRDCIADRDQRRHLMVAAIESAKHPSKMRNLNRCPDARISCILAHRAAVMREPHAAIEGQPRNYLELIFNEKRLGVCPRYSARPRNKLRAAGWVCVHGENLIVPLPENLNAS